MVASCPGTSSEQQTFDLKNNSPFHYRYCTWKIMVPAGKLIKLAPITEILLNECCTLIVYDGPSSRSNIIATLSVLKKQRIFVSTGNAVLIEFNANPTDKKIYLGTIKYFIVTEEGMILKLHND